MNKLTEVFSFWELHSRNQLPVRCTRGATAHHWQLKINLCPLLCPDQALWGNDAVLLFGARCAEGLGQKLHSTALVKRGTEKSSFPTPKIRPKTLPRGVCCNHCNQILLKFGSMSLSRSLCSLGVKRYECTSRVQAKMRVFLVQNNDIRFIQYPAILYTNPSRIFAK